CADLLAPVERARATLIEARQRLPEDKGASLVRKGLFALAVSSVEVMISDVLVVLLNGIPEKLPAKDFSVSKRRLVESPFDILGDQIEQYVRTLGYKALDDLLEVFAQLLGIRKRPVTTV